MPPSGMHDATLMKNWRRWNEKGRPPPPITGERPGLSPSAARDQSTKRNIFAAVRRTFFKFTSQSPAGSR
jgi:hypothetical protein